MTAEALMDFQFDGITPGLGNDSHGNADSPNPMDSDEIVLGSPAKDSPSPIDGDLELTDGFFSLLGQHEVK